MIGRLAFRSLTAHPIRSAVLGAGFGAGVAVMAILLGVAEIVLDQATSPALVGGGDVLIRTSPQVPGRLVLAVGAVGAFLLGIPLIGFFPSAALLMVGLPVALGYRVPIVVLPVTIGFLVLVWFVFVRLFAKPLPTGMIWGG